MARRIPYTGFIPYMTARLSVKGYRPTETSRFAVVRIREGAAWDLVHVRSGMSVGSLLPALSRALNRDDKLAVAAAFEAQTHLNWTAFDALEELGPNFNGRQSLDPATALPTVNALRDIAAQVLA